MADVLRAHGCKPWPELPGNQWGHPSGLHILEYRGKWYVQGATGVKRVILKPETMDAYLDEVGNG